MSNAKVFIQSNPFFFERADFISKLKKPCCARHCGRRGESKTKANSKGFLMNGAGAAHIIHLYSLPMDCGPGLNTGYVRRTLLPTPGRITVLGSDLGPQRFCVSIHAAAASAFYQFHVKQDSALSAK